VEIQPGSDSAAPVANDARIATTPTHDLNELLARVSQTLQGLGDGTGSLGKLLKDDKAYNEVVQFLSQSRDTLETMQKEMLALAKEGRGTMSSLKQDADAIKGMPFVRNYITDNHKELVRPDCERYRKWYASSDLFEPGAAALTATGKQSLDLLVPWLEGLKHKGSEVVVVSYAEPAIDPNVARTVSLKQSKAVCDYLTTAHSVQKMGWFSWSRKVTPLGGGNDPPPLPETDPLPAGRTEVIVFVPKT
jgi:hypothetical protein